MEIEIHWTTWAILGLTIIGVGISVYMSFFKNRPKIAFYIREVVDKDRLEITYYNYLNRIFTPMSCGFITTKGKYTTTTPGYMQPLQHGGWDSFKIPINDKRIRNAKKVWVSETPFIDDEPRKPFWGNIPKEIISLINKPQDNNLK